MQLLDNLFAWGANLPPAGLYLFVFAWLFVESTGFPISDEPLLLLAGSLTITGHIALVPVILIALLGKVAASCLAFWIGHYVNFERLARPEVQPASGTGRWLYYIRPTMAAVMATEDRVRRQGMWGVFFGRLIPIVRSFISYPAGALRMPFPKFLWATAAGSLLWITIWTVLGAALGNSYHTALSRWGAATPYILIGLIVLLIIAYVWNHRRAEAAALRLQAQKLAEAAKHVRHPHAHNPAANQAKSPTKPKVAASNKGRKRP